MTTVASPPSLQPLSRLGWNSSNGVTGTLDSMSAEDVSRMFMPRKSVQRTNSSSSVASSSSTASTVSASQSQSANGATVNGDGGSVTGKKKPTRGLWPSSKAEPTSSLTTARPQAISAANGTKPPQTTAQPAHQPSPIVPSQHTQRQQNGLRINNGQASESGALLALLPMNGTFERKQIVVPFYPDTLRVGRQTNAKTVPTPVNGYFDSKVLSRAHAEVWADRSGKIFIRDIKSSNGTFVNGQRLSPENRESEPHELREHDVLELGIDIVSEDQKEIVHHKVSAKVEFAGVPGATNSVLDLNFGDIDPSIGVGLLPSPLSQPLGRGRPALGGRGSAPSSVAGSQLSAISQQKQFNFWSVPVNVDHVVKLLSHEMKQIKQQNSDLGQTGTFLQHLLTPDDKDKAQAPATDSQGQRQVNGRPKTSKIDPIVRFSDPPAPPPQQPLPEKPDARSSPSDSIGHAFLKRSETERPRGSASASPTNSQSSQILSLVDALSTAKKELDSQGARVKQLEDLLKQERAARETAEERARQLESSESSEKSGIAVNPESSSTLPSESNQSNQPIPEEKLQATPINASRPPFSTSSWPKEQSEESDLQSRLDLLVAEMQEMKQQMEKYRQRAEKAETDASSTRASLTEMIEHFRRENAEAAAAAEAAVAANHIDAADSKDEVKATSGGSSATLNLAKSTNPQPPSSLRSSENAGSSQPGSSSLVRSQRPSTLNVNVHQALVALLHDNDGNPLSSSHVMLQSAPYASMLGVVLIGVGLMAYLNSWQGSEK